MGLAKIRPRPEHSENLAPAQLFFREKSDYNAAVDFVPGRTSD